MIIDRLNQKYFRKQTAFGRPFEFQMPVDFQPTHPRNNSKGSYQRGCRVCQKRRGVIRSYGIYMCRRCFRERADKLGFVKYD